MGRIVDKLTALRSIPSFPALPKSTAYAKKCQEERIAAETTCKKDGAWVVLREKDLTVIHEARDSKKPINVIRLVVLETIQECKMLHTGMLAIDSTLYGIVMFNGNPKI